MLSLCDSFRLGFFLCSIAVGENRARRVNGFNTIDVVMLILLFWFSPYTAIAAECDEGLTSLSDIESEVDNGVAVDNRVFIFPNINFTCEARIVKWKFFAQIANGVILQSRDLPDMQIWRKGIDRYTLYFSTDDDSGLSIKVKDDAANYALVQYTLSKGVIVHAGDVFGMRVPGGTNVARFHPLFLDLGAGNAPAYFYLNGQATQQSFLYTSLTPRRTVCSFGCYRVWLVYCSDTQQYKCNLCSA